MSVQIDLNQPPFSFLSPQQREWLVQRLDLVFFAAEQVILDYGQTAPGLYIIFKGVVEESDRQQQVVSHYGREDIFDVRALLSSTGKHRFTASEETLCYLLPAADFIQLLKQSDDFSVFFHTDLGTQASLVEQRDTGVSEFIMARVDEQAMRSPVYVNGQTSLARVTELMREQKSDAVLVRSAKGVGIVTGTDLLHATLLGDHGKQSKVLEIAQYQLIRVEYGDFLFSALLKMTQYQIERVVVEKDGDIVGVLELMDMLSLFSTHSHVIAMRIEQSRSLSELALAAQRLELLIRSLSGQGVNTVAIMELITTLNRRLLQRAFDIIFPERLRNRVCILVLGSEGRGEQILKTDQDNAVILNAEHEREAVMPLLNQLHQVLLGFGYPPCPGGVMFINDGWIHTVDGWQGRVNRWLRSGSPEAMMNMAILMDGEAICGDTTLFAQVRSSWQQADLRSSMISAWFAKPALQFDTPLTLLGNIREDHGKIDIKKGGIFPLVHGVRALAFEFALEETNTLKRLDWLQQHQILDDEVVQGLKDALLLFIRIRLRQQLQSNSDNPGLSQQLNLQALRSVDRSLLRHALRRVKKFKQLLVNHFHLESF